MEDKQYYTMEEVDKMLKEHIAEEHERRSWYEAHDKDSDIYKFMKTRDEAFEKYFLFPISPFLQLMADGTVPMKELTKKEQKIVDNYLEVKKIYNDLQETYLSIYEKYKKEE